MSLLLATPGIAHKAASGGTLSVTFLGARDLSGTVISEEYDLSSYGAGDIFVVTIGSLTYIATTPQLDGVNMTQLASATNSGLTSGQRVETWYITLSGAGSATATLAYTSVNAQNSNVIKARMVEGGQIVSGAVAQDGSGNDLSLSVTPTDSTNIIDYSIGSRNLAITGTDVSWSSATEIEEAVAANDYAYAQKTNAPTSLQTETVTQVGTERWCGVAVLYEPV